MSFIASVFSGLISAIVFQLIFTSFVYYKKKYQITDQEIFEITEIGLFQSLRFSVSLVFSAAVSSVHAIFFWICMLGIFYTIEERIYLVWADNFNLIYPFLVICFVSLLNYMVFVAKRYSSMIALYKALALNAFQVVFFTIVLGVFLQIFLGSASKASEYPVILGMWIFFVLGNQIRLIFDETHWR